MTQSPRFARRLLALAQIQAPYFWLSLTANDPMVEKALPGFAKAFALSARLGSS